jgi:hypothetical protein
MREIVHFRQQNCERESFCAVASREKFVRR